MGGVRPSSRLRAGPRRALGVDGGDVVQRHPSGTVRVVGRRCAALRRLTWHHDRPSPSGSTGAERIEDADRDVLETLLEFAVHDLGRGGSARILVFRPALCRHRGSSSPPEPPALDVRRVSDLTPLRHLSPDGRRRGDRRRRRAAPARGPTRPSATSVAESKSCGRCATRRATATASTTRRPP